MNFVWFTDVVDRNGFVVCTLGSFAQTELSYSDALLAMCIFSIFCSLVASPHSTHSATLIRAPRVWLSTLDGEKRLFFMALAKVRNPTSLR